MKLTAIEWLFVKSDFMIHDCHKQEFIDLLVKAKEVEKQYIMDAFIMGINNGLHGCKTAEEYYEKTYKK